MSKCHRGVDRCRVVSQRALAMLTACAAVAWSDAQAAAQSIPAFSGADGAGAYATGGRGGIVYRVTKLDKNYSDTSIGTLRYGLTDSNFPAGTKRTIVFDVAGTFWLGRYGAENGHDNGWDTQSRLNWGSNVTIAGQTAPGPVYIMGGVTKANGVNNIIRNVTVAPGYGMRSFSKPEDGVFPTPGDFPDSYVYDAFDISGQNIIIDHVSALYATDEAISANEQAANVTVQYSNISQGQNYPQADAEASGVRYTGHALGSLLELGNSTSRAAATFHHNLYAHQKSRVPQTQAGGLGGYYDFRNNVFYNWLGTAGSRSGTTFWNLVNNFYLAGPGGDDPVGGTSTAITTRAGGTSVLGTSSSIFRSGNLLDTNKDGDANDGAALASGGAAAPIWMNGVQTYNGVTDSATTAYSRVLDYTGPNWWQRDGVIDTPDERIINEVRTGTGKIMAWADDPFNPDPAEGVEWRQMLSYRADPATGAAPFVRPAGWDVDVDGIPGWWEDRYGLSNSVQNHNEDRDGDGYTEIEEYINYLAAWPASGPITFANSVSNRWAQINNWHVLAAPTTTDLWQPSRYDTARLATGTAVVDAVGQYARIVEVGSQAGQSATLSITDGWLEIAETVKLGSGGTGAVSQTGGLLTAQTVTLGALAGSTGTYNLSGGTLVTTLLNKGPGGGTFNFTGGVLHADTVAFALTVSGGTLAPGNSIGHTQVLGNLTIASGELAIEIDGLSADTVGVTGLATLGGLLDVSALNGFRPRYGDFWEVLIADGGVQGDFAGVTEGFDYDVVGNSLIVIYVALAGDVDVDYDVDFDDLGVLLGEYDQAGPELTADIDRDGDVDFDDLGLLLGSYGEGTPVAGLDQAALDLLASHFASVPEPGLTGILPAGALLLRRRR